MKKILIISSLMILLHNNFPEMTFAESGEGIYKNHCAKCHGKNGEGRQDEYEDALFGDRSITSLAGLIERTMPENEPEIIRGDDALKVAKYIYHAFYSPKARTKLQPPPRVEMARLTVPQYRNVLADLLANFPENVSDSNSQTSDSDSNSDSQTSQTSNSRSGISAQYFQSKGMNKADEMKMEKIDMMIDFDFGEGSPAEDIVSDQFSIIWQGGLRAPDTGHYEFRLTTENGVRLYLNSENTGRRHKMRDDSSLAGQSALIDGWVSSGTLEKHRGRAFLLGGRVYPFRLEFFKYKEKTASVRLEWKPPHSAWKVLDARFLQTEIPPRSFVVATPFPADDRSSGYERGSSISAGWLDSITQGATEATNEIILRLPFLAGYEDADNDDDRLKKTEGFILKFAERAFRHPISEARKKWFSDTFFKLGEKPESATRRAILSILTSPNFLYLTFDSHAEQTSYDIAERLAFTLWDSIPDAELLKKAESEILNDQNEIATQISRMLQNDRTRTKLRAFFHDWLEVEDRDFQKDEALFPDFDEAVVDDLRYSLECFIEDVIWSPSSDYRRLFLSDIIYLNGRLQKLYVKPKNASDDDESDHSDSDDDSEDYEFDDDHSENHENHKVHYAFSPVSFEGQRSGILTHPFLLSAFAYHDMSSPIHRGVFLTRNVMGRRLKPPPVAVAFKNDEFPDGLSMREKITRLTSKTSCMTCHGIINPLGFTLENFDAIGRWRRTENHDLPIDSSNDYTTLEGEIHTFQNAKDIARFASQSDHSYRSFIMHLFSYLTKQSPSAYGEKMLEDLCLNFAKKEFSIIKLVSEIAQIAASYDLQITNKKRL